MMMLVVVLKVLVNIDDLFEREELSASSDIGWPDCFNSGVFVYRPSHDTYSSLLQLAATTGSFDGQNRVSLQMWWNLYRVAQKSFGTIVLYALTLPYINRFSMLFHSQNQEKICKKNTVTKDPTTSQVCRQ